jgi:hypothetical protein
MRTTETFKGYKPLSVAAPNYPQADVLQNTSTDTAFWLALSPLQNTDCARKDRPWPASRTAFCEKFITFVNGHSHVIFYFIMSDKAYFELPGCVSKQNTRYWNKAKIYELFLKPLHSQKITGEEYQRLVSLTLICFRIKLTVRILWHLTDRLHSYGEWVFCFQSYAGLILPLSIVLRLCIAILGSEESDGNQNGGCLWEKTARQLYTGTCTQLHYGPWRTLTSLTLYRPQQESHR